VINRFIKAMYQWFIGGMQLLPKSVIMERWRQCFYCGELKCSYFRYYCDECKCTVSTGKHPLNKLAHPCQECPKQKFSVFMGICNEDS